MENYKTIKVSTIIILDIPKLLTDLKFIGLEQETLDKVLDVVHDNALVYSNTDLISEYLRIQTEDAINMLAKSTANKIVNDIIFDVKVDEI